MKHRDLPQRWKNRIEVFLRTEGSKYREMSVFDSSDNIKITFDDGSNVFFKHSFYLMDEETKEIAVFTENCGYHLFNLTKLLLETIDYEGNITKIEDYQTE